jgi:TetR/AcrR family transcriptional regulator, fatty acid biosynthesis regulator
VDLIQWTVVLPNSISVGQALTLTAVSAPPSDVARLSRAERKEHTRRALLHAALAQSSLRGFAAVSLRETARAAGIVPTAFYRHFDTLDELGLALTEEAIRAVRDTMREIRRSPAADDYRSYVRGVFDRVDAGDELVGFLVRERHGGCSTLRRAIAAGLETIARELSADLSRGTDADTDTLDLVADLLVSTVADRIAAGLDAGFARAALVARTEHQVRIILRGCS